MTARRDDWEYARTRQQHFDEAELALIREAFTAGIKAQVIARQLKCSTRAIQARYAKLHDFVDRAA